MLGSTGLLALGAALSPAQAEGCYYNVSGKNIFAVTGDVCTATSAAYYPPPITLWPAPPPPPPGFPAYTGFGFLAFNGGIINAPDTVAITTKGLSDAYGAWSDGAGSQINLNGLGATARTSGDFSYGFYASNGGAISSTAFTTVVTSGASSAAIEAVSGGQISVGGAKITTFGDNSPGAFASGANSTITATGFFGVLTNGAGSDAAVAEAGGTVVLSGGGFIITTQDGSSGLVVHGTGSTLTADGVNVTELGDSVSPFDTGAAVNAGAGELAGGGTLTLTNSYLTATGTETFGVYSADGGVTNVTGGSITAGGQDSIGVISVGGATTSLSGGLSVTATGLGSTGVEVSGSGSMLTGSSVTIAAQNEADSEGGFSALGVYNGAGFGFTTGGTVSLTDSSISSTGFEQNALLTSDGGTTTIVGGSINTTGNGAYAVADRSGGLTQLNGTAIGTTGDGSGGMVVYGAGSEIDATNVTITTQGGYDSASGYHAYGLYNGPFGSEVSGGVAKLTDTSVSTQGDQMYAVLTSTGGATTILGGSITTEGTGATAIFSENGGATTVGVSSIGPTTIATTGAFANGVESYNGGTTAISGGSVSTSGATALGLYATGAGSSITTSNGTTIVTTGADANGVQADTGGAVGLSGGSVTTSGAGSQGLAAFGAGSTITATGVAVTTNGDFDASSGNFAFGVVAAGGGSATLSDDSIVTSGAVAHGVVAGDGGTITLNNGTTVLTTGDGSAGLFVNGAGASLTATDVSVTTHGAIGTAYDFPAVGAYNGSASPGVAAGGTMMLTDTTILTTGSDAYGLETNSGGQTTFSGGSVKTTGDLAFAILTETGGTTTVGLSSVGPTTLTTSGNDAPVVVAQSGGLVTLAGSTVSATGALGSSGLVIQDAGSEIDATNVTVTTQGAADAATGRGSYGLYNGPFGTSVAGGVANISDSSFSTQGAQTYGVLTSTGGTTTVLGGSVSTSGDGADALVAESGGVASVGASAAGPTTLTTTGSDAYGAVATSGGSVTLTGSQLSTSGDGSGGLAVIGAGSSIAATGASIATQGGLSPTTGLGAYGLYNGPFGDAPSGGTASLTDTTITTSGLEAFGVVTATGGTTTVLGGSVSTSGDGAHALVAESGGVASVGASAAGPTTLTTTGSDAYGAVATSGGSVTLTGSQLSTSGDGSGGLAVIGAGSSIAATGASIVTQGGLSPTTGLGAYGLYNGPFGDAPSGGTASLTNTTITTSGAGASGIAALSGTTSASGGSITTSGQSAFGVYNGGGYLSAAGGSVSVSNVTITTAGAMADGVRTEAQGQTSLSGGSIGTTGLDSAGAATYGSGVVSLTGTRVTTTGAGSVGLGLYGSSATLNASGVKISTKGGYDPVSGQSAYGVYNGPHGDLVSGGTASLTNSSVSTSAAHMVGVYTTTGGTTKLTGTGVTTDSLGAHGVESIAGGVTNISGGAVTTAGQDAHALYVTGAGSQANLSGAARFATQGAGSIGLYAALGAVVLSAGSTTITTAGGVSPATGLGAYGVNADGAGSQIKLGAASITTAGAGAFGLLASDAAASGTAGSITATGTLNVTTTNASATAVGLQGNGATILATGGGKIVSAGNAISLTGGTNQTATFDNFTIANQTGDLVFADPSVSTINFNNTVADAGTHNLLDATGGSSVTLNASASTLTGAIQTDAASMSNVNLTNGTTWNLTAPSTVTSLNLMNSIIVFAPPGSSSGFKTLTVGNYVGTGAGITINAALGGTGSASDQIIINGGKATGTTLLTINNVGGLGAQTTGNGIPIIVAVNGGTTASNAFSLANAPVVGAYKYSLEETNDDWYLVSSPTTSQGQIANLLTDIARSQQQQSVTNVAKAQQQQIITSRVLGSILLGATEQVNCSNCSSGFGAIGSYALGAHGRWSLSDQLTAMGGFSYNEYSASGITVTNAPTFAGSLVYDLVNWGHSRPFFEVGGGATPFEQVRYSRTYPNGLTSGVGNGNAIDRGLAIFGRAGWVARITPIDEAAVYGDLSRNWLLAGGYTEGAGPANPFPSTVQTGLETINVARAGAQWTHLFNGKFEVNVSGAVAYGFGIQSGSVYNVADFGAIAPYPIANSTWLEYGGRVGYRVGERMVIDAFLLGTVGGIAGSTVHGGVGLRYLF